MTTCDICNKQAIYKHHCNGYAIWSKGIEVLETGDSKVIDDRLLSQLCQLPLTRVEKALKRLVELKVVAKIGEYDLLGLIRGMNHYE